MHDDPRMEWDAFDVRQGLRGDGKKIQQMFQFQTVGLSMGDTAHRLSMPRPDFVKMDVNGFEQFILEGGPGVLGEIKGILIEVNDDFKEQAESLESLLTAAGLLIKEKRHSEIVANSTSGLQHSYNQIWVRR